MDFDSDDDCVIIEQKPFVYDMDFEDDNKEEEIENEIINSNNNDNNIGGMKKNTNIDYSSMPTTTTTTTTTTATTNTTTTTTTTPTSNKMMMMTMNVDDDHSSSSSSSDDENEEEPEPTPSKNTNLEDEDEAMLFKIHDVRAFLPFCSNCNSTMNSHDDVDTSELALHNTKLPDQYCKKCMGNDENAMLQKMPSSNDIVENNNNNNNNELVVVVNNTTSKKKSLSGPAFYLQKGKLRSVADENYVFDVDLHQHPNPIVETKVLSADRLPARAYIPRLPLPIITRGLISSQQYLAVVHAGQQHEKIVENIDGTVAYRQGFFIGDGTGVGKGRELAAIAADNWFNGRRRILWISCSRSLLAATRQDFIDLGLSNHIRTVYELGGKDGLRGADLNRQIGGNGNGVIFSTYSQLFQTYRTTNGARESYVDSLTSWLRGAVNEEAVILFDEIHKAKNLYVAPVKQRGQTIRANRWDRMFINDAFDSSADEDDNYGNNNNNFLDVNGAEEASTDTANTKKATKTGIAVKAIQDNLPNARIVYASATGTSNASSLAPFIRLGLWGSELCVFNNFKDAHEVLKPSTQNANMASLDRMELLSREFVVNGNYLSRALSFEGCVFDTNPCPEFTMEMREMYDEATRFVSKVYAFMEECREYYHDAGHRKACRYLNSVFWSTHQKLFKMLMVHSKIDYLVKEVTQCLADGCSPVIGLWSTGEASLNRFKDKIHPRIVTDKICSTVRETLYYFLTVYCDPESNERDPEEQFQLEDATAILHREKLDQLLDELKTINWPASSLELLIERLGGENNVAELSGRSLKQRKTAGGYIFCDRSSTTLEERDAFMNGEKNVAIITAAGSTGISLHSDLACKNQKKQVLFITELSWAADSMVQQLGRVHRSNQKFAPEFRIIVSRLGGESRYIGAIKVKLRALGAMTKGERNSSIGNSAGAEDFSSGESFFDNYGTQALRQTLKLIAREHEDVGERLPPSVITLETHGFLVNFLEEHLTTGGSSSSSNQNNSNNSVNHLSTVERLGLSVVGIIFSFLEYDLTEYRLDQRLALANIGIPIADTSQIGQITTKRFFNRLGGMSYMNQQNIYGDFKERYDILTSQAKAENKYKNSSNEIIGSHITLSKEPEVVHTNEHNVQTKLVTLDVDIGTNFEMAARKLSEAKEWRKDKRVQKDIGSMDGFYKWATYKNTFKKTEKRTEYFLVIEQPDYAANGRGLRRSILMVWTPHRGKVRNIGNIFAQYDKGKRRDIPLLRKLRAAVRHNRSGVKRVLTDQCDGYDAKVGPMKNEFKNLIKFWNLQNEESLTYCSKCINCRNIRNFKTKRNCKGKKNEDGGQGTRMQRKYILSGLVLHLWDVIEDIKRTSRARMTFANDFGYDENEGLDGANSNNGGSIASRRRKRNATKKNAPSSSSSSSSSSSTNTTATTTTTTTTATVDVENQEEDDSQYDHEIFQDMGVVKATTDDGRPICGLEIHPLDVKRLVKALNDAPATVPERIKERQDREERNILAQQQRVQKMKEETANRKRVAEMEKFAATIKKPKK